MTKSRIRVRSHREIIVDYDYIEKLEPSELHWLQTFSDEFYSGYFRAQTAPVHPSDLRRDCFSRNSKINRDLNNKNTPVSLETLPADEAVATEGGPEVETMLSVQYGSLIAWMQSSDDKP